MTFSAFFAIIWPISILRVWPLLNGQCNIFLFLASIIMSDEFNEELLLHRVQVKKDPDAFGALYDVYVKRIYRFVYFKVSSHEEAEDITADVFLKTWNYLQERKRQEIKSFGGLLYRIARNCIIDLYRSRAPGADWRIVEGEVEMGDGGRWYGAARDKIETEQILLCLKKLKQEYQEVITLRYVDELEIDEIAEITGKGKIAVRVTLHRALKKLRTMMKSDEK